MKDEPHDALRRIAGLPSETAIHFIVYCAVIGLVIAYVIGTPAYVLFFGEGRRGTGLFVLAGLAVVVATVTARRRGRAGDLELFPTSPRAAPFRALYARTAADAGFSDPLPPLLWSYSDQRTDARTVRWNGAPAVVVSAGLVQHARTAPDDVRGYLMHEFGHVANGDLTVFEWTLALASAFRLVTVLSVLAATVLVLLPTDRPSILFFASPDTPVFFFLLLMVGTLWLLTIALAWLLVVRYAGVLTSLRELHADVRAAAWMAPGAYVATIRGAHDRGRRSRLRSLLTPRLIHLSARERVDLLEDPVRLAAPKVRYFALVAVVVLLLQSSPFTVGTDENIMRIAPLSLWAALAVAYLLNLIRVAAARPFIAGLRTTGRSTALAATTGILFALPVVRSPQLYPSMFTFFSDRAGTLAVLNDEWWQWNHVWGGAAAVFAASGIAATFAMLRWMRFRVDRLLTRHAGIAAGIAAGVEVGVVGLALFMSSVVTPIDAVSSFTYSHRMALGALPAISFITVLALTARRAAIDT